MRGDVLSLFVGETLDKILKTNLVPYMATPALLERQALDSGPTSTGARRHLTYSDYTCGILTHIHGYII